MCIFSLPNDYNFDNNPKRFIEAEARYAQSDVTDGFLNVYGTGDGGGGPSRMDIEMGRRLHNTEGCPRVMFAYAEDYFNVLRAVPRDTLPKWSGEMYLELHRGTYTSQGRMKQDNRNCERAMSALEFLCTLTHGVPKPVLDRLWKQILLHQFHDILPGSSIGEVYDDAKRALSSCQQEIGKLTRETLTKHFGTGNTPYILNTLGWERTAVVELSCDVFADSAAMVSSQEQSFLLTDDGAVLPVEREENILRVLVTAPAMGVDSITNQGSRRG